MTGETCAKHKRDAGRWGEGSAVRRPGLLPALVLIAALVPAGVDAATASLYGTTTTPTTSTAGQVVNPGSATGAPDSTYAQVYPNYSLVLSGFPTTDLGALTSAALTITYGVGGTRPASGRDTWQIQYSTDGGATWPNTVASGTNTVTAPVTTAAATLTGMTWAGLANLRVRAVWTLNGAADTTWYIQLDGATVTATYTPNSTTAGTVTAAQTAGSSPSISIQATFSDDANANNSATYQVAPAGTGSWAAAQPMIRGAGTFTATASGLTCGSSYDVQVTYSDSNGVTGTNPVTAPGVPLTNCTLAGAVTMDASSCGSATVSAAFTNDLNGDGSTTFERGSSASGPWTAASCSSASGGSPRQCVDVASAGTYWYRATFTDPDGVTGSPAVSAGSATVTACGGGGGGGGTLTLSNGTDPVGVTTLSPNGTGWLDGFGLSASGATVSSVQVTIPANATALASVFIHSKQACTGGTTYGSVANPVNGANAIATAGLTVAAGVPLYVCVTAKPHGAVGGAVRVTGTVTGVTAAGFTVSGTDATGGTLGIDDVAPGAPTGLAGTPGAGAVSLAWTNPSAADLAAVIVVRDTATISWTPSDGVVYAEGATVTGTVQVVCTVAATPSSAGRCYDSSASGGPYYFRAFARDAYGNYSVASASAGPVTPLAFIPDGDPVAGRETPVVSIINPTSGAVLTLNPSAKVQIRAFSPGSRAFVAPGVELLVNGVAKTPTKSTNYSPTTSSGVWEYVLGPTDNLAPGTTVTLRARATNTALATPIYSTTVRVRIAAAGTLGDGNLLRRDNSSQLCNDCHAVSTHSSETTGTKYGSWAVSCRDCHTPHSTRNVMLVAEQITPPSITGQETPRTVVFTNRTGYGDGGYANASFTGPCQVCHTRTSFYNRTADGGHETGPCNQCHGHDKAFRGEGTCASCHLAAAGAPDVDDLVYGNGSKAVVSRDEWLALGHGRATASGAYPSGSGAANFDAQGTAVNDRGCAYCHTNGVGHGVAANFFRLTQNENDTGNVEGLNGTCLKCHGSAVYDSGALPGAGYANLTSTKKVDSAHSGAKHGGLNDSGGQYCWDCHDPHGDRTAGAQDLWYMVQRLPIVNSDAGGVPVASIMTPQVVPNPVEFRASLAGNATSLDYLDYVGGGSYPAGPTLSSTSGFCRNCHETVAIGHYTVTESDGHFATALGATPNSRCTDCHKHRNAFQAQCNTCHASPPNVGKHYGHDEVFAASPTVIPNVYAGTVRTTATQYGFACSACHGGTHINATNAGTAADPYLVEVAFSGGGTYTRSTEAAQQGTDPLQYFGNSNGTCATTYCHSRATPLDQTGVTIAGRTAPAPTWTQAAGMTCTSCHDGGGATSILSSAHRKHTSAAAYGFECAKCHVDTVNTGASPTLKDKTRHVDGVKSVAFDATNPGAQAYASPTCGTLYCHSNGSPASGTIAYTSPGWSDAPYSTCGECHGNATTLATNAHAAHLNNSGVIGTNYVCADCHNTVVASGNQPITGWANHVNGTKQLGIANRGTFASNEVYVSNSCDTTYCHSSGQRNPTYRTIVWTTGSTACNGCHGTGTTTGAPDYGGTGTADTATANSHAKHVGAATDCATCHNGFVTAAGTAINGASHTNGVINMGWDTTKTGTVTFVAGTYTAPSTYTSATCASVKCHGNNATPLKWGGPAMKCSDCHVGAADADSFAIGTAGIINTTEWTSSGHGQTTFGANTLPTIAAGQPCLYCHDPSVPHQSSTATNPFRLLGATGAAGAITNGNYSTASDAAANATCLNCHGTSGTGVNPASQGVRTSVKKINSWHAGADHATFGTNGGRRCWDCHDPHGDANVKMIGKKVVQQASDLHSFAATRVPATGNVVFTSATAGNYVTGTATRTGICQVCHVNTSYWRYNAEPTAHKTAADDCMSCHAHEQSPTNTAFAGKGGGWDCIGCHGGGQGSLRAITNDFSLQSHHVRTVATLTATGAGTFSSSATGAAVGNNRDCVVCHAEGQVITTNSADCPTGMAGLTLPSTCTNPAYHGNKRIDLRDVDVAQPAQDSSSNTFVFTYDKAGVATSAGATLANWGSGNQAWRVWTSGVAETGGPDISTYRAGLDRFCLNCHDSNGAAQITSFRVNAGASPENGATQRTATDPFWDGAGNIGNTYDQYNRADQTSSGLPNNSAPPTSGGHVIDIKSKVSGAPPAQGSFARHAIRGQSTSKYTNYVTGTAWPSNPNAYSTLYSAGKFTSTMGTDESGKPNWNDSSVMGCADCHTTDGANGTSGNAHGSTSEYLLKDATGGAAEGSYGGGNENCARCHNNYGTAHTGGNGSDFQENITGVGAARMTGTPKGFGSIFGLACMNCHGGAQGTGAAGSGDTNGFGWIHGTSQVFPQGADGGGGTRNAYRFLNGSSLRFYQPGNANWDSGGGTCYTLNNRSPVSNSGQWGTCTQHSGGTSAGTNKRPLTY